MHRVSPWNQVAGKDTNKLAILVKTYRSFNLERLENKPFGSDSNRLRDKSLAANNIKHHTRAQNWYQRTKLSYKEEQKQNTNYGLCICWLNKGKQTKALYRKLRCMLMLTLLFCRQAPVCHLVRNMWCSLVHQQPWLFHSLPPASLLVFLHIYQCVCLSSIS